MLEIMDDGGRASMDNTQEALTRTVTVDVFADALALRPQTVRLWCAQRKIAHYRIGRSIRISLTELKRLKSIAFVAARRRLEHRDGPAVGSPAARPLFLRNVLCMRIFYHHTTTENGALIVRDGFRLDTTFLCRQPDVTRPE